MPMENEPSGSADLERRVGRRVRQLRENFGWSQAELGKRLTLSGHPARQSTVAKMEAGSRPLRVNELQQLADAFGLSIFDLLEEVRVDELADAQQQVVWATGRLRRIDTELERAEGEIEELKKQRVSAHWELEEFKGLVAKLREMGHGEHHEEA